MGHIKRRSQEPLHTALVYEVGMDQDEGISTCAESGFGGSQESR